MSRASTIHFTKRNSLTINFLLIAKGYHKRLSINDRPAYKTYMSHLGRNDLMRADEYAKGVIEQLLRSNRPVAEVKLLYHAYSIVSKVTMVGDSKADEIAFKKFLSTETRCKITNRKLRYMIEHPERCLQLKGNVLKPWELGEIREDISEILGPVSHALTQCMTTERYGPGKTCSSRSAKHVSIPYKLSDPITVTQSCVPYWIDFLREIGFNHPSVFKRTVGDRCVFAPRVTIVNGCLLRFVPKTISESRTIAVEPSANVMFQLGVHSYLERRLAKFGVYLDDQTKNRSLALSSSSDGTLGTIDLSSASDCVSVELVRLLLPADWFAFLDDIRSSSARYRDSTLSLEKFSSSGNGFTFALETIIFLALTRCVLRRASLPQQWAVYGDDIIVPISQFSNLIRILRFFGFKANARKSFNSGNFRESCGCDAWLGHDIRPIFPRSAKMDLADIFAYHNQHYRRGDHWLCEILVSMIPQHLRLFGPPGPEAGFLFTEDVQVLEASGRKWSKKYQSYGYRCIQTCGRRLSFDERLLLDSSLYHGGVYSNGAPLRGAVFRRFTRCYR